MVTETLINDQHHSYSLDSICEYRFGKKKKKNKLLEWIRTNVPEVKKNPFTKKAMGFISLAPDELVHEYLTGDIELTDDLFHEQVNDISNQELYEVHGLESNVLKVLTKLERRGVPVNLKRVERSKKKFEIEREILQKKIKDLAGFDINTRSGKQLEKAFKHLKYPIRYNKKTGNPMFSKEEMQKLDNPLSRLILDERSYGTLVNTFLARLPEHAYDDGRVRCNFHQTKNDEYGALTGRLSSSDPNLMQIPNPKRSGEKSAEVRACFCAPDGYRWVSADWEQFEFRVFAHYSKDPKLIHEFELNPDADYHQVVSDLTGVARDPYAKQLNLGLIFGMGMGLMAKKCDLPYSVKTENGKERYIAGAKAKQLFEKYHTVLPTVRKMLKNAENIAKRRGYVKTIYGRRIRFHNPDFAYKAGGLVFQGTSADLMKVKLIELDEYFEGTGTELLLPVHDEFDFITADSVRKVKLEIAEILEYFPQLRIPIKSDIGVGKDWMKASM